MSAPDGPNRGVLVALEALHNALMAASAAAGDLRAAVAEADHPMVFRPPAPAPEPVCESPAQLLARVAAQMRAPLEALRGKSKQRHLARQRRVAAAVLRMAGHSHPEIADAMHRDHSTSMLWTRTVEGDPELRDAALRLAREMGVADVDEAAAAAAASRQLARTRNRTRRAR